MPPPLGSQPGDTYPLLRLLVLLRFLLYLCLIITDSVTDVNTKMTCVTKFRRINNKTVLFKSTPCRISVTLSHSKRRETSVILTKHMVGEVCSGKGCFSEVYFRCNYRSFRFFMISLPILVAATTPTTAAPAFTTASPRLSGS